MTRQSLIVAIFEAHRAVQSCTVYNHNYASMAIYGQNPDLLMLIILLDTHHLLDALLGFHFFRLDTCLMCSLGGLGG